MNSILIINNNYFRYLTPETYFLLISLRYTVSLESFYFKHFYSLCPEIQFSVTLFNFNSFKQIFKENNCASSSDVKPISNNSSRFHAHAQLFICSFSFLILPSHAFTWMDTFVGHILSRSFRSKVMLRKILIDADVLHLCV